MARKMFEKLLLMILPMFLLAGFINTTADEVSNNSLNIGDLEEDEIRVAKLDAGGWNLISGRAVGVVDASIDTVWEVLSDYNNYQQFMPRLSVTYLVDAGVLNELNKKKNWSRTQFETMLDSYRTEEFRDGGFYFYNVMDMPFPFPDFWFLLRMERNPSAYRFHWTMVYGNMLLNEGSWELKPYGSDSTKTIAVYMTRSDPGVYIPNILQKFALKSTLPDIIKNLRRRALLLTSGKL
jgi:hypothetical protein